MKRVVSSFVVLLSAATVSGASPVPAGFQGEWVAARAACTAPVKVRIEAARLTLVNGADTESFGGVEMAGPGYFPPDFRTIQEVLITEFDTGDQPVQVTFNYQEKKGVGFMEMMSPLPARDPSAELQRLNARFAKLDLVKRFPLHKVPLKRCAPRSRGAAR